jgi:hypothetical protein
MAEGEQQQQQQQQAPPWHNGIEAETLGFWQNKGLPLENPKDFAAKLTEQYRSLEKHIGVPADRILRLPEKAEDVAGWDGVYQRLGVPKEAKDYDLTGLKFAGADLDPAFADAMRAALQKGRVPKDAAAEVAKPILKFLEDADSAELTVATAKLDEEKNALKKSWGPNYDYNHLKAMEGARRLGITPEAVASLEKQIGYSAVMEAMRKIGAGTSEDTWHDGSRGPGGHPTTREGAQSKLNELMNDAAWGKRLTSGDPAARAEWEALTRQITPEAA